MNYGTHQLNIMGFFFWNLPQPTLTFSSIMAQEDTTESTQDVVQLHGGWNQEIYCVFF